MTSQDPMTSGPEVPLGPKPAMERTTASQVMNPRPRTCSKFSTVMECVLIFKDEDCGMVPVVEDGEPVGVVTDRDVALSLNRYEDLPSRPVTDIMSSELATVSPEASLHEVTQAFMKQNVRRLLVVDSKGLLVGVISWADIVPWLSYQMTGLLVAETIDES